MSSDHSPIVLTYYGRTNLPKIPNVLYKTNWLKYKKYISCYIPTNPRFHCEDDVKYYANDFTSMLQMTITHSTVRFLKIGAMIFKENGNNPDHQLQRWGCLLLTVN